MGVTIGAMLRSRQSGRMATTLKRKMMSARVPWSGSPPTAIVPTVSPMMTE